MFSFLKIIALDENQSETTSPTGFLTSFPLNEQPTRWKSYFITNQIANIICELDRKSYKTVSFCQTIIPF